MTTQTASKEFHVKQKQRTTQMIQPDESLLKYDEPVLVRTATKSSKGRPLRVSPQLSTDSTPTPPPPRSKPTSSKAAMLENEILDIIFPPREWAEENQLWVQQVSRAPSGKDDVQQLVELLDAKLQQRQARHTGICLLRRELYSQCFDELIRQVTNNCAERGLLLARVRDEINETIDIYQTLYQNNVAFGTRKELRAEEEKADMEQKISDLENENKNLRKQLDEQKAHCDEIEKTEADKRQVEEKNFSEEIHFLKKIGQQYQALLERMTPPKQ